MYKIKGGFFILRKREKRNSKIGLVIKEHIKKNIKEYLIVSIIFLIGILIGVIVVNNISEEQQIQMNDYINTFIECINSDYKIDMISLLKSSIINNLILAFILWFVGSTVIGIPIVYLIIGLRGFLLGYSISTIMLTFSLWKGILFTLLSMFLQNIIFIPCIFAIAVSGMKLYKMIIKDKKRDNIKLSIIKHTIYSFFAAIMLVLSSLIEVYCSSNLIILTAKFFA